MPETLDRHTAEVQNAQIWPRYLFVVQSVLRARVDARVRDLRAWLHKPSSWIAIACWGSLGVFVLVGIGLPLFGVGTFLDTQLMTKFAPWTSTLKSMTRPTNIFVTDTLDGYAPQPAFLVQQAHQGVLGQWDPYSAGGVEVGGLPDSGAYSPLSLPWWILPLSYAPGAVKLLEIVAITVGMSLFLRRLNVPSPAWPVASLIYAASGFMIAWTNWPQTRVAAFIPLLFWAVDRVAVLHKKRDVLSVGLIVMSLILGGFPAVAAFALFVAGPYVIVRSLVVHRSGSKLLWSLLIAFCGLAFGGLLSAWQVIPLEIDLTHVVNLGIRAAANASGALGLLPLISSYVPDVIGLESTGTAWSGLSPVEGLSYVGITAVVLLVAALLIRPRGERRRGRAGTIVFLFAALAVCVDLTFFGGPLLAGLQHIPPFDSNPIGRMRSMVGFLAAVLAGIGFGALLDPAPLREELREWRAQLRASRAARFAAAAFAVLLGLAAVAGVVWALFEKVPNPYRLAVGAEAFATFIVGALVVVGIVRMLLSRSPRMRIAVSCALPLTVLAPALVMVHFWWPTSSSSTVYPTTSAISYLQKHVGDQRIATEGQTLLPGASTYYDLRAVGGHDFETGEWSALLTKVDPAGFASPTYESLSPHNLPTSITSPILDRLGVEYVIVDPDVAAVGAAGPAPGNTRTGDQLSGTPLAGATEKGPLRGVELNFPETVTGPKGVTLEVRVVSDADGAVLARTSTWDVSLDGLRSVTLMGEDIPASTAWHLEVTVSGASGPVPVAENSDGTAAATLIRPRDDGLSVVHTGDATIYRRSTALQRVHWASSAVVETDATKRIDLIDSGRLAPDAVVLSTHSDAAPNTGGTATVTQLPGTVNQVAAKVDASAAGWLVVEDSLQRPGWSATVDGKPAKLVAADEAGGAVRVPAGTHTVVLSYSTPGLSEGLAITFVTVAGTAVVLLAAGLIARRRRRLRRA